MGSKNRKRVVKKKNRKSENEVKKGREHQAFSFSLGKKESSVPLNKQHYHCYSPFFNSITIPTEALYAPSPHHDTHTLASSAPFPPPRAIAYPQTPMSNADVVWEMRPGGMFVQRRQLTTDNRTHDPMINLTVTHASSHHEVYLPAQSTFLDVKKMLAHKTGLQPEEQRLFFRGKEKENEQHLHMEGVQEKSKLLLLEEAASKERKLEEIRKHNEMLKASEAVARVSTEVDKLSERVSALEVAVDGGTKVADKEFVVSTELLMRQLLKLDGIEAEGEAKLQRKAEVRRVQYIVDTVDSLKAKNSNPFSNSGKSVSVTTKWETYGSGMGSLNAPTSTSSSANVTQDWEQFE